MNRALLKNRSFVFLISAQTVSNMGDWFNILALMTLLALKWNASPFALSAAMLCLAVPNIFLGSLSGVIADRFNRKYLMIATDILRAIVVIGIIFSNHLWQVYSLLCLLTIFSSLFQPAKEGKLRELVDNDLLQSAVATSELINNGTKVIGPMISGVLVATVGVEWSFYLDSFSFILSALLLLLIPGKHLAEAAIETTNEKGSNGFWSQFSAGFHFIKTKPQLLTGMIVFCIMLFSLQICDSQFPILLREIPSHPIRLLGWVMAGSGLGTVIAALYLNNKEIHSALKALSTGACLVGTGYILCAAFIHIPVMILMISYPIVGTILGFSFGLGVIHFNVMAQKTTPNHFTGRVFGTIGSATTLAAVIGILSGGIISKLFGAVFTFILSGVLLILVGIIVYIGRRTFEGGNGIAESNGGTHQQTQE
ncbi:MFS transporter [Pullulanibacillus camelliae]|uniref:MFS transporter n=1 Tax=Pullulanibacillus camelliae TaxID=1707096 RepID=A0A8J2VMC2_9BACL|nr:MFS transporter [Pullulanibacillus camelliae]GGE32414.1 MFS transporter [Pullulanibacillus camelliae]